MRARSLVEVVDERPRLDSFRFFYGRRRRVVRRRSEGPRIRPRSKSPSSLSFLPFGIGGPLAGSFFPREREGGLGGGPRNSPRPPPSRSYAGAETPVAFPSPLGRLPRAVGVRGTRVLRAIRTLAGFGSFNPLSRSAVSVFPRGTGALSATSRCLAFPGNLPARSRGTAKPRYSRTTGPFPSGGSSTGLAPSSAATRALFRAAFRGVSAPAPTTPKPKLGFGLGLFPFRSPLLGESLLVSFPPPQ